jgi:hypothetical protein
MGISTSADNNSVPKFLLLSIFFLSLQPRLGQLKMRDFDQALALVNKVGAVAEKEGHHPDLYLVWGKCKVEIWTHNINGLTESDFYMAAKTDKEFQIFRA